MEQSLKDLYNPNNITAIYPRKGNEVAVGDNGEYGFQEYPRLIELWQLTSDGRLHLLKRWRKSSIAYMEYDNSNSFGADFKPYIYPKVK